eukprot:3247059-Prymnesium_polylepis.2
MYGRLGPRRVENLCTVAQKSRLRAWAVARPIFFYGKSTATRARAKEQVTRGHHVWPMPKQRPTSRSDSGRNEH